MILIIQRNFRLDATGTALVSNNHGVEKTIGGRNRRENRSESKPNRTINTAEFAQCEVTQTVMFYCVRTAFIR